MYRAALGSIDVEEAIERVSELAESCDGAWNRSGLGGRLAIPVAGGLRRGWVGGHLSFEPTNVIDQSTETTNKTGKDVVYRLEEENWTVHAPSVAVLSLAGAGALTTVLWPFFPALLPLAPMGFLLAIGAWFLVVRQVRHRGPQDFLNLIVAELDQAGSGTDESPKEPLSPSDGMS